MFKNGVVVATSSNGKEIYSRSDYEDNHIHNDFINEEVVKTIISKIIVSKPFEKFTVDIGKPVGRTALVETNDDDEVFFMRRGDRPGFSRMIKGEKKTTTIATVIICKDKENNDRFTIVTAFPGEAGEKEPWDPSIKNEDELNRSKKFWSCHALVAD